MKLTPAAYASATMRLEASSSVGPPNVIVPRQIGETLRPERPNPRYSIRSSFGCPEWTAHRSTISDRLHQDGREQGRHLRHEHESDDDRQHDADEGPDVDLEDRDPGDVRGDEQLQPDRR